VRNAIRPYVIVICVCDITASYALARELSRAKNQKLCDPEQRVNDMATDGMISSGPMPTR